MQIKSAALPVIISTHLGPGRGSRGRAHQPRKGRCLMKEATTNFVETAKTGYVITLLVTLGIFAAITAVLIAWPALAYLGSKLM